MAQAPAKKVKETHSCSCEPNVERLVGLVEILVTKVAELEADLKEIKKPAPRGESINKVEGFNGEFESAIESYIGMKLSIEDKVASIKNACMILPPNLVKDGRHNKENIQALVGFEVTEEMFDEAYKGIVHEAY